MNVHIWKNFQMSVHYNFLNRWDAFPMQTIKFSEKIQNIRFLSFFQAVDKHLLDSGCPTPLQFDLMILLKTTWSICSFFSINIGWKLHKSCPTNGIRMCSCCELCKLRLVKIQKWGGKNLMSLLQNRTNSTILWDIVLPWSPFQASLSIFRISSIVFSRWGNNCVPSLIRLWSGILRMLLI